MAFLAKAGATFDKPYFRQLADKIQAGESIKTKTGMVKMPKTDSGVASFLKAVKVGTDSAVLKVIYPGSKWADVFAGKKWSEIDKGQFTGKSGGAGAGTIQTRIAEATQCVWNVCVLKNPRKAQTEFTKKDLKAAYDSPNCKVHGTTFDEIYNIEEKWHKSGYLSAKKLVADGWINLKQEFHHGTPAGMDKIYKLKKDALSNSDLPNITNDKWNPGDFWAIEKGFRLDSLDISSIKAYNMELIKQFKAKKIVGISLKQVKKTARISVLNETNDRPSDFKYSEGQLESNRGDFFSNKSGTILFKKGTSDGKMEIRTNNSLANHKVEIMLATARGGGCGWGEITEFVKEATDYSLPNNPQILDKAQGIVNGQKQAIDYFWKLATDCGYDKKYKKEDFMKSVSALGKVYVHSKLGALELIAVLERSTAKQANQIIAKIHNYAGSQLDLSSVYIKVYE